MPLHLPEINLECWVQGWGEEPNHIECKFHLKSAHAPCPKERQKGNKVK